jgi:hypothetical protein
MAQHAITKFRKDIIHLQEDGFEKSVRRADAAKRAARRDAKTRAVSTASAGRLSMCASWIPKCPLFFLDLASKKSDHTKNQSVRA